MSKTVLEVLQATAEYFAKNGVESPRLNADLLLGHVMGKKRLELYLEFDRPLGENELGPMRELVRQRAKGHPLQHLLGTAEFCGRKFRCDRRALIPRPETEELVDLLLKNRAMLSGARILDVGTGSGVIALTLAAELPGAVVEAADISEEALALAGENAVALGLGERVRFFRSDLMEAAEGRYHLVVANLPYVAAEEMASLPRELLHDPALALDGGPGGTGGIERLIAQVPEHIEPGGLLALETGAGHAEILLELLREKGYHGAGAKPDLAGIPRFIFANYG